jgi:hypothetical protein
MCIAGWSGPVGSGEASSGGALGLGSVWLGGEPHPMTSVRARKASSVGEPGRSGFTVPLWVGRESLPIVQLDYWRRHGGS